LLVGFHHNPLHRRTSHSLHRKLTHRTSKSKTCTVPKNLSDPYLREWSKSPKNPLMAPTASNQINASSFRDLTTAWLGPGQRWRVILTGLTFLPCHCEQTSVLAYYGNKHVFRLLIPVLMHCQIMRKNPVFTACDARSLQVKTCMCRCSLWKEFCEKKRVLHAYPLDK